MKRTVCLILAIMFVLVAFSACADRDLIGTWVSTGSDGLEMRLVFEKNDKGYMTAMGGMVKNEFEYSTKNGKLELKYSDDESYTYGYEVTEDKITLTNDEGTELVYTKKQ